MIKKRPLLRLFSVLIAFMLLSENVLLAEGEIIAHLKGKDHGGIRVSEMNFPGWIRPIKIAQDQSCIINIQDAHSNLGAQKSIAGLLEQLVKKYEVNLVGLEGSAGPVDTRLLTCFPLPTVRQDVAQSLLADTKISAAEFFNIASSGALNLYGVEDSALYSHNVAAAQALAKEMGPMTVQLEKLTRCLKKIEEKVFSSRMRELNEKADQFENSGLAFENYWQSLAKVTREAGMDYHNFPQLKKMAHVMKLQSAIDFPLAQKERGDLIDLLRRNLSRPEFDRVAEMALSHKLGQRTAGKFYAELLIYAKKNHIMINAFPTLRRYAAYTAFFENIDLMSLIVETKLLKERVCQALLTTQDEIKLYRLRKTVSSASALMKQSADISDYHFFINNQNLFSAKAIQDQFDFFGSRFGISVPIINHTRLNHWIKLAGDFYAAVEKRNEVMFNNLRHQMQKKGQKIAVLISGGFHKESLSALMSSNRVRHVILMPRFKGNNDSRPYMTVLTLRGSYLDQTLRHRAQTESVILALGLSVIKGFDLIKVKRHYLKEYGISSHSKTMPFLNVLNKGASSNIASIFPRRGNRESDKAPQDISKNTIATGSIFAGPQTWSSTSSGDSPLLSIVNSFTVLPIPPRGDDRSIYVHADGFGFARVVPRFANQPAFLETVDEGMAGELEELLAAQRAKSFLGSYAGFFTSIFFEMLRVYLSNCSMVLPRASRLFYALGSLESKRSGARLASDNHKDAVMGEAITPRPIDEVIIPKHQTVSLPLFPKTYSGSRAISLHYHPSSDQHVFISFLIGDEEDEPQVFLGGAERNGRPPLDKYTGKNVLMASGDQFTVLDPVSRRQEIIRIKGVEKESILLDGFSPQAREAMDASYPQKSKTKPKAQAPSEDPMVPPTDVSTATSVDSEAVVKLEKGKEISIQLSQGDQSQFFGLKMMGIQYHERPMKLRLRFVLPKNLALEGSKAERRLREKETVTVFDKQSKRVICVVTVEAINNVDESARLRVEKKSGARLTQKKSRWSHFMRWVHYLLLFAFIVDKPIWLSYAADAASGVSTLKAIQQIDHEIEALKRRQREFIIIPRNEIEHLNRLRKEKADLEMSLRELNSTEDSRKKGPLVMPMPAPLRVPSRAESLPASRPTESGVPVKTISGDNKKTEVETPISDRQKQELIQQALDIKNPKMAAEALVTLAEAGIWESRLSKAAQRMIRPDSEGKIKPLEAINVSVNLSRQFGDRVETATKTDASGAPEGTEIKRVSTDLMSSVQFGTSAKAILELISSLWKKARDISNTYDPDLRIAAAYYLECMALKGNVSYTGYAWLGQMVHDPNELVAYRAIMAIGQLSKHHSSTKSLVGPWDRNFQHLRAAARGNNEFLKLAVVQALADIGDPRADQLVLEILQDENSGAIVLAAAAEVAGKKQIRSAAPYLIRYLLASEMLMEPFKSNPHYETLLYSFIRVHAAAFRDIVRNDPSQMKQLDMALEGTSPFYVARMSESGICTMLALQLEIEGKTPDLSQSTLLLIDAASQTRSYMELAGYLERLAETRSPWLVPFFIRLLRSHDNPEALEIVFTALCKMDMESLFLRLPDSNTVITSARKALEDTSRPRLQVSAGKVLQKGRTGRCHLTLISTLSTQAPVVRLGTLSYFQTNPDALKGNLGAFLIARRSMEVPPASASTTSADQMRLETIVKIRDVLVSGYKRATPSENEGIVAAFMEEAFLIEVEHGAAARSSSSIWLALRSILGEEEQDKRWMNYRGKQPAQALVQSPEQAETVILQGKPDSSVVIYWMRHHPKISVRIKAAQILAKDLGPGSIDYLVNEFEIQTDQNFRLAVLSAVDPYLDEVLRSADPNHRLIVLLEQLINHKDSSVELKIQLLKFLTKHSLRRASSMAFLLMKDADPSVRMAALDYFVDIAPVEGLTYLETILSPIGVSEDDQQAHIRYHIDWNRRAARLLKKGEALSEAHRTLSIAAVRRHARQALLSGDYRLFFMSDLPALRVLFPDPLSRQALVNSLFAEVFSAESPQAIDENRPLLLNSDEKREIIRRTQNTASRESRERISSTNQDRLYELIGILRDHPDPNQRMLALARIDELRAEEAIPVILRVMDETSVDDLAMLCGQTLVDWAPQPFLWHANSPFLQALEKRAKNSMVGLNTRMALLRCLGKCSPDRANNTALGFLNDADPTVQMAGLDYFVNVSPQEALSRLETIISVRGSMNGFNPAQGRFIFDWNDRIKAILGPLLKADQAGNHRLAMEEVGRHAKKNLMTGALDLFFLTDFPAIRILIPEMAARSFFLRNLLTESGFLSEQSIFSGSKVDLADPEGVQAVLDRAKARVPQAEVQKILSINENDIGSLTWVLCHDNDSYRRVLAAYRLGQLGLSEAVPFLMKVLSELHDDDLVIMALDSIAQTAPSEFLTVLNSPYHRQLTQNMINLLTQSRQIRTRALAVRVLGAIHATEALRPIREFIAEVGSMALQASNNQQLADYSYCRSSLVSGLKQMGPPGVHLVFGLLEAETDYQPLLHELARILDPSRYKVVTEKNMPLRPIPPTRNPDGARLSSKRTLSAHSWLMPLASCSSQTISKMRRFILAGFLVLHLGALPVFSSEAHTNYNSIFNTRAYQESAFLAQEAQNDVGTFLKNKFILGWEAADRDLSALVKALQSDDGPQIALKLITGSSEEKSRTALAMIYLISQEYWDIAWLQPLLHLALEDRTKVEAAPYGYLPSLFAVEALGRLALPSDINPRWSDPRMPVFFALSDSPDSGMRRSAVGLGQAIHWNPDNQNKFTTRLKKLLEDNDPSVILKALEAVGNDARFLEAILEGLGRVGHGMWYLSDSPVQKALKTRAIVIAQTSSREAGDRESRQMARSAVVNELNKLEAWNWHKRHFLLKLLKIIDPVLYRQYDWSTFRQISFKSFSWFLSPQGILITFIGFLMFTRYIYPGTAWNDKEDRKVPSTRKRPDDPQATLSQVTDSFRGRRGSDDPEASGARLANSVNPISPETGIDTFQMVQRVDSRAILSRLFTGFRSAVSSVEAGLSQDPVSYPSLAAAVEYLEQIYNENPFNLTVSSREMDYLFEDSIALVGKLGNGHARTQEGYLDEMLRSIYRELDRVRKLDDSEEVSERILNLSSVMLRIYAYQYYWELVQLAVGHMSSKLMAANYRRDLSSDVHRYFGFSYLDRMTDPELTVILYELYRARRVLAPSENSNYMKEIGKESTRNHTEPPFTSLEVAQEVARFGQTVSETVQNQRASSGPTRFSRGRRDFVRNLAVSTGPLGLVLSAGPQWLAIWAGLKVDRRNFAEIKQRMEGRHKEFNDFWRAFYDRYHAGDSIASEREEVSFEDGLRVFQQRILREHYRRQSNIVTTLSEKEPLDILFIIVEPGFTKQDEVRQHLIDHGLLPAKALVVFVDKPAFSGYDGQSMVNGHNFMGVLRIGRLMSPGQSVKDFLRNLTQDPQISSLNPGLERQLSTSESLTISRSVSIETLRGGAYYLGSDEEAQNQMQVIPELECSTMQLTVFNILHSLLGHQTLGKSGFYFANGSLLLTPQLVFHHDIGAMAVKISPRRAVLSRHTLAIPGRIENGIMTIFKLFSRASGPEAFHIYDDPHTIGVTSHVGLDRSSPDTRQVWALTDYWGGPYNGILFRALGGLYEILFPERIDFNAEDLARLVKTLERGLEERPRASSAAGDASAVDIQPLRETLRRLQNFLDNQDLAIDMDEIYQFVINIQTMIIDGRWQESRDELLSLLARLPGWVSYINLSRAIVAISRSISITIESIIFVPMVMASQRQNGEKVGSYLGVLSQRVAESIENPALRKIAVDLVEKIVRSTLDLFAQNPSGLPSLWAPVKPEGLVVFSKGTIDTRRAQVKRSMGARLSGEDLSRGGQGFYVGPVVLRPDDSSENSNPPTLQRAKVHVIIFSESLSLAQIRGYLSQHMTLSARYPERDFLVRIYYEAGRMRPYSRSGLSNLSIRWVAAGHQERKGKKNFPYPELDLTDVGVVIDRSGIKIQSVIAEGIERSRLIEFRERLQASIPEAMADQAEYLIQAGELGALLRLLPEKFRYETLFQLLDALTYEDIWMLGELKGHFNSSDYILGPDELVSIGDQVQHIVITKNLVEKETIPLTLQIKLLRAQLKGRLTVTYVGLDPSKTPEAELAQFGTQLKPEDLDNILWMNQPEDRKDGRVRASAVRDRWYAQKGLQKNAGRMVLIGRNDFTAFSLDGREDMAVLDLIGDNPSTWALQLCLSRARTGIFMTIRPPRRVDMDEIIRIVRHQKEVGRAA